MCGKASINDGVLQKSRCLVWFYIWSCRKKMMIELTHTQTIAAIYVSFAASIISFEIQRVGTKIPKVGTKIRTSRNWNFYRSEFYAQPIAASTIKHPIAPPCLCWRVEAYWIRPWPASFPDRYRVKWQALALSLKSALCIFFGRLLRFLIEAKTVRKEVEKQKDSPQ